MNKRYKFLSILLLIGIIAGAQAPAVYPAGSKINWVRTWDAMGPETNPDNLIARPLTDVRMATQYLDGVGRPVQTVIKQGSLITGGTATDLTSTVVYDELGREQYKFLPSPANTTNGNTSVTDGLFKRNPFEQQTAFYSSSNAALNPIAGQGETYYYGKTDFEASPLSRPLKGMAAGNSWVGAARGVQTLYVHNTATDAVRIWNLTSVSGEFAGYTTPGTYPEGVLYKTITTDEHGKQVIEYKDKDGLVILKKVQLTAAADNGTGSGHSGWLCTYYIYDKQDRLVCVIQPVGVEKLIENSWTPTSILIKEQCFRYAFNERGLVIARQVPGSEPVNIIYDRYDRQVMIQDGNMKNNNEWLVTIYDNFNRVVQTGMWSNIQTGSWHTAQAAAAISDYPFSSTSIPVSGWDMLTRLHYDSYTNLPSGLSSTFLNTWNTYLLNSSAIWPFPVFPTQRSAPVKGMATWQEVKVLKDGPPTYLASVVIYDDKSRVIQTQTQNISGGVDVLTTQYTWLGQPLISIKKTERIGSSNQTTVSVTKKSYDELFRLLKIENKTSISDVNGGTMPANFSLLSKVSYDALGQLKIKKIGRKKDGSGNYTSDELESLLYDYNIQGWLLGMNRAYVREDGLSTTHNYFGFDLGYDKTNNIGNHQYSQAQYNGNISGTLWRSSGDKEKRKYDFIYDAAGRMIKADFSQYTNGTFNKDANVDFSMGGSEQNNNMMSYDGNGNIKELWRKGLSLGASDWIDKLTYNYKENECSNRLNLVTDISNNVNSILGDFKYDPLSKTTKDYDYDANGNLLYDKNKKISNIVYNYLSLPAKSINAGKGTIEYIYDATGNKLQKIVTNTTVTPSLITSIDYISGAVYENGILQFIANEEGRTRYVAAEGVNAARLEYDYIIKDHLGNVRVLITEEQKVDKYPLASLEDAKLATEEKYYIIDQAQIVDVSVMGSNAPSPAYDNDNGIGNNPSDPTFESTTSQKMYRVNSTTNKMGLGITLKVMAGDKVDVLGKSHWYTPNTSGSPNVAPVVLDILSGLLGAPGSAAAGKATASQLSAITDITTPLSTFLNDPNRNDASYPQRPKAFINYIFFDEQFRMVSGGASPVNPTGFTKDHFSDLQNLAATKNGYLHVYISNESPVNVFFDNLQLVHVRGAILEESHYYPFGLIMAGISSKAAGNLKNRNRYIGKEEQRDEFKDFDGLEWTDFGARMYDNQLGRWNGIDPKAYLYFRHTPYSYALNDPINYLDDDGELIRDQNGNVVFIPLGRTRLGHRGDPAGADMTVGYVIANDGVTLIKAYKNLSNKKGFDTDCHGETFTSGQLWIDNDEVRRLLKADGYSKVESRSMLKKGDAVIYTNAKGLIEDSRTVSKIQNGKITVYGQGGIEVSSYESDIDKTWTMPGTKQEYWRRSKPDPKLDPGQVQNAINEAKARNGIRSLHEQLFNFLVIKELLYLKNNTEEVQETDISDPPKKAF